MFHDVCWWLVWGHSRKHMHLLDFRCLSTLGISCSRCKRDVLLLWGIKLLCERIQQAGVLFVLEWGCEFSHALTML